MRRLGLDVGGTNIKRVVLEGDRIAERDSQPTGSEDGVVAVLERVAALARQAGSVNSVGIALPGLVDGEGRGVLLPNLHGDWRGQPIAEPLSEALQRPVRLINDGHAFALAEARVGAARGADDVLCIVCGTGIGGGLLFLTPQRIVVGGGVAEAGELLLGPLRVEVEKRAGRVAPLHAIEIVPATLGADAGAVGAALAGAAT
jgi:glucokinase